MTKGFPKTVESIEDQIAYMQKSTGDMESQILKTLKLIKNHYCSSTGENVIVSLSKDNWKKVADIIY